ncbi:2Fe-2S iron-sulfur cluster-binding protein [Pigmentiphaga soli]|uniref:2Fe-2S iron-sulfur cluster-binding protein n=1 Tax=Pigmentiphaga soli TaxID=1007095 RepID=A0ABP8H987_9BURK
MTRIIYQNAAGQRREIDAPAGRSVMQVAVANGVDGIVAECGGSAMCATCHVYVEAGPVDKLPAPNAVEDEMLESTAEPRMPNSRLSCQLVIGPELDGLVVRLPERQV